MTNSSFGRPHNAYAVLQAQNDTPERKAVRAQRKAELQTRLLDKIGPALRTELAQSPERQYRQRNRLTARWDDGADSLGGERAFTPGIHPGDTAVQLCHEIIAEYTIPARVTLRYAGMERTAGASGHGISEGVILVEGSARPNAGLTANFTIPVIVRAGKMLPPALMISASGIPSILSQSAFDDLISYHEVSQDAAAGVGKAEVPISLKAGRSGRTDQQMADDQARSAQLIDSMADLIRGWRR